MPMSPRLKARRGRFGVAGLAPVVKILSPASEFHIARTGSPLTASLSVEATATDDGSPSDLSSTITWTSNLEAGAGSPPVLGTGGTTTLTLTVAGTHTITASAGDGTNTGTATIIVYVS